MTFKKWLTAFLILLLISPLILTVYAGPGPEPVKEHPWDEVKQTSPVVFDPDQNMAVLKIYSFQVLPFHSGIFILVVVEKKQEVVKKDLSVNNISLPRKK